MRRTANFDQHLDMADEALHTLLAEADRDLAGSRDPVVLACRRAAWRSRLEQAAETLYLESWNAIHARTARLAG